MDDRAQDDAWSEPPSRTRWGLVVLCLLFAAGVGVTIYFLSNTTAARDAVRAVEGRLTTAEDDGKSLETVDRQEGPEIWFRVLLDGAPVGEKLDLTCDWVSPDGRIVHRNHYTTRAIDKPSWPTHARYRFEPTSPLGTWTVRLKLKDRVLHSTTFEVTSGKPAKGAP